MNDQNSQTNRIELVGLASLRRRIVEWPLITNLVTALTGQLVSDLTLPGLSHQSQQFVYF